MHIFIINYHWFKCEDMHINISDNENKTIKVFLRVSPHILPGGKKEVCIGYFHIYT